MLTQYCSGNHIKKTEMGGECSTYGESRSLYRVLVGKTEVKTSLGRPRLRWKDDIKKDLQELGCEGRDWIDVAQDTDMSLELVKAVMNHRFPYNAGNFLTS
jgi:hypothetical protein